jgi:hypothetical protein
LAKKAKPFESDYVIEGCLLVVGFAVAQLVQELRGKPMGSIPDGVIKIFHLLTPSSRTVADKASREICTIHISCGVKVAGA